MRGLAPVRAEPDWCGFVSGGFGGDGDVESGGFELSDESSLACGTVTATIEVVTAEVVVDLTGREEMPDDYEDRVTNSDGCTPGSSLTTDAVVVRSEVRVFAATGGVGCFDERDT